jgi:pimeloyl-ACP methyl ester carboxylesterase
MRVATNGVELEVEVQGDGEPVLLLHGWPDDHHLWDAQVDALVAAGYRTIAPDLRGFGQSSKPDGIENYALWALLDDVIGLLDALDVGRAHVVGHDWGAALGWLLASAAPGRVDHLVAMSVGHLTAFANAGMEQRERSWYMLLFQFEDIAEQWLSDRDWTNFRAWSGHPAADDVIKRLSAPGALTATLNLYRANMPPRRLVDPPAALPAIETPTLGVWSTGDRHLLESQMRGSAAYAKPFRYERVADASHWLMLDQPAHVNELLLGFLPDTQR